MLPCRAIFQVPESPFFIQLASSKALVVQSAYRAHLARRVKQRRMTSWRGLNEILMVRRIQKIWRGVIARRKRAESERLEELALRRSAGLLISTYCIRKLLYSEDVRRLRDDLIGSDEHLAKRVNEFAVQSRPTPLDLGHLSSAAARLGQVPASTHVAESGSQSQREVDRDDAGKTEAMVLLRAYDACAGSSASSFLEGFGYTDDDIEAFFDGCGPSPLGDRSVVPPNLFLQGAAALLERHANQRYTAIEPPPAPTSVGEESTGGDVEVVWKLPVGFDWKSTKVEDCLAQINKIYVYRDMIKSALVIQCGWRSQRSRQAVCEMVGMQRSNVCEQIRRARQLATEREAALQIAQSAKDRVASYATCIQCALRCHMSRARLVLEREYREIFLLNKTQ